MMELVVAYHRLVPEVPDLRGLSLNWMFQESKHTESIDDMLLCATIQMQSPCKLSNTAQLL